MAIKGDLMVLYVWDDVIYRPIACLTSNSISETREIIESQTKCNPGVINRDIGTYSYELSAEGEYIDTTSVGAQVTLASHDYLRSISSTKVQWKMSTGLADTTDYFGTAIITDLSADFAAGETSTFSASLSGDGEILSIDPNI